MPYIRDSKRALFDYHIKALGMILTPMESKDKYGCLNYIFTRIIKKAIHIYDYSVYNSVIGVLECCKIEFYRRNISPYENKKIEENGDV